MKKLGLALGSGGALGFAHIGVIKALRENNIKIEAIAGSSAGAVVGGYYALYNRIDSLESMGLEFVKENPFKLFDFTNITAREKKETRIRLFLEEQFKDRTFRDTKIPFASVATNLETGDEVVIKKGRLLDAVFASMAVPGVFDPVFFWGKWLVDGGVVNPTPLKAAKDMNVDFVLGVDLTKKKPKTIESKPKYFYVVSRTLEIMISDIARFRSIDVEEKMILYPKFRKTKDAFNEKIGKEYIQIGYESMLERIDELKNYLREK